LNCQGQSREAVRASQIGQGGAVEVWNLVRANNVVLCFKYFYPVGFSGYEQTNKPQYFRIAVYILKNKGGW